MSPRRSILIPRVAGRSAGKREAMSRRLPLPNPWDSLAVRATRTLALRVEISAACDRPPADFRDDFLVSIGAAPLADVVTVLTIPTRSVLQPKKVRSGSITGRTCRPSGRNCNRPWSCEKAAR